MVDVQKSHQKQDALQNVLATTATGTLVGLLIGSIKAYTHSPVIVGYSRAPAWRDVSVVVMRQTRLYGSALAAFSLTNNFVAQFRGLDHRDVFSTCAGGLVGMFAFVLQHGAIF